MHMLGNVPSMLRRALIVAVGIALVSLGGCTDKPVLTEADPTAGPEWLSTPFRLEPLDVIACKYGGTWPNCNLAPAPSGPAQPTPEAPKPGPGSGTGTQPGSTGGGTGTPPQPVCDPQLDPNCEKPLSAADTVMIRAAIEQFRRPKGEFTDSIARRECGEMEQRFLSMMSAGLVFRGTYSTDHYAAYWQGRIHIDPKWLDSALKGNADALREVAISAFHEAGHALGYSHGNPTFVGTVDYYTEPYFSRLNPGANSCVRR